MPNAYRTKRFNIVSNTKRRRLLEENLVPILNESDSLAENIQNYLKEGDWLIEYIDYESPLYIFRVKAYRHEPRLHLYIKHFIQADLVYELSATHLPDETKTLLAKSEHLEALPKQTYEILDDYAKRMESDLDERLKQLIIKLKLLRNTLTPLGRDILLQLENGKMSETRLKEVLIHSPPDFTNNVRNSLPDMSETEWEEMLSNIDVLQWENREKAIFNLEDFNKMMNRNRNGPANIEKPEEELVDPSKITGAISKAALETYTIKHNGKLPTLKEFEKLTKQFITTRRRRR